MTVVDTDYVECRDDVTGAVLIPELVIEARRVEMEFFTKMQVYDLVPRDDAYKSGKGKVIKGRWIDTNKGDSSKPDYRSRFVGKEFNTGVDAALYAATPPLEALKLLVSHAAGNRAQKLHMMFSDVKRAYFNAEAKREIYVEPPREDPNWRPGVLGKLRLALYGTRDAASLWQECLADHLVSIGFVRGVSNPCVFYHSGRSIRTLVHGDDYASVASLSELSWLRDRLEARFEMKTVMVGHSTAEKVEKEGKILNRVIRATPDGWEYESDQRHVEAMIEDLELGEAKALATPGIDEAKKTEEEQADSDCLLGAADATAFRAVAARGNYLAQDRPDIQFAVKELCRSMSSPKREDWNRLKRLGRYLSGRPRAVGVYPWQDSPQIVDVYSDANWAGCHSSRKSTSGGAVMFGRCCVRSYSKTQNTIAQSSAESELIGTVKAATEALGIVSLCNDLGILVSARLHVDASAAIGILDRKGVGRVRHLDIGMLWMQENRLRRVLVIQKVVGTVNPPIE